MLYLRSISYFAVIVFAILALYILSIGMGLWNPSYEEVQAKYADAPSEFVEVGDVRLHVRDEGQGPVVLMLHSSQTNLRIWDQWAENLKNQYRVIRIDWPPYGLSIDPKPSQGSKALVKLLHQFIEEKSLDDLVFVSSSSGATLSVLYTAEYPEKVRALALSALPLAAPPPSKTSHWLGAMNWVHQNVVSNYLPRYYYSSYLDFLYGDPSRVTPEAIDLFWYTNNLPGGFDRVSTYYKANLGSLWSKGAGNEASAITVPVLLQWGDKDPVLPKEIAAEAAAEFKNAKVELIHYADVGHYPMLELPNETAEDLKLYLARIFKD